jgi:hypothetical protein
MRLGGSLPNGCDVRLASLSRSKMSAELMGVSVRAGLLAQSQMAIPLKSQAAGNWCNVKLRAAHGTCRSHAPKVFGARGHVGGTSRQRESWACTGNGIFFFW